MPTAGILAAFSTRATTTPTARRSRNVSPRWRTARQRPPSPRPPPPPRRSCCRSSRVITSSRRWTPTTGPRGSCARRSRDGSSTPRSRSEEHTSELQSQSNLVCRLLLEKKKNHTPQYLTARKHYQQQSQLL